MPQCEHEGCTRQDVTECIVIDYRCPLDFSVWDYVSMLGPIGAIRHLWRLWRDGSAEWPPEHYCPEHCQLHGFCYGCGQFWAGCERFDFDPSGLCPNCQSELDAGLDWDDDDWPDYWADYPGELLADNLEFVG